MLKFFKLWPIWFPDGKGTGKRCILNQLIHHQQANRREAGACWERPGYKYNVTTSALLCAAERQKAEEEEEEDGGHWAGATEAEKQGRTKVRASLRICFTSVLIDVKTTSAAATQSLKPHYTSLTVFHLLLLPNTRGRSSKWRAISTYRSSLCSTTSFHLASVRANERILFKLIKLANMFWQNAFFSKDEITVHVFSIPYDFILLNCLQHAHLVMGKCLFGPQCIRRRCNYRFWTLRLPRTELANSKIISWLIWIRIK